MNANPYLIQGPALISFSGGRTSGYMLKHILDAHGGTLPVDVKVAFANTGLEAPETLDFVQECSERWNVQISWLEFDPTAPHSTRIVNHNTASRNGEPLEAAIDTRPTAHLFSPVSRYCTGTTKQRRLEAFGREICGWREWKSARGIRADEKKGVDSLRDRYAAGPRDRQVLCLPLADAGVVTEDVRAFLASAALRLASPVR
jgi:3'-phosphoadenosine 5'-phosphosulfate sulfotransferase (PAPS reductase)/FAD synthetase